eukprot:Em0021g386a
MKGYRRVTIVEEFYHILKQIHDKDCLQAGSRKTYARVQSLYSYIPRVVVENDNGKEFVNKLIEDVVSTWHVNGRPRHPQSQGLVEQAHYTLKRMISAKVVECGDQSPPWSQWLPHIVYTMNTQVHDTTKQTPYELVFGQPPRAIVVPDVNFQGQLDEDVLKPCDKEISEEVTKDKEKDDKGKEEEGEEKQEQDDETEKDDEEKGEDEEEKEDENEEKEEDDEEKEEMMRK